MALVEECEFLPARMPGAVKRGAGEAIQLAAHDVPQRVAGERVQREQNDVGQQDQRSQADAEVVLLVRPEKKKA